MAKHFMVDIETLSTAVNAAVLSIGAVEFGPFTGQILRTFYHELDLSEQDKRHVDLNTVQWWFKQCQDNPANFELMTKHNREKDGVEYTLLKLREFLTGFDGVSAISARAEGYERVAVWACDPDFDVAILNDLYKEHNLPSPWRYSELRSVRTVRDLTKIAGMDIPKQEANHNALDDCIRQVKEVTDLLSTLHTLGKNRQNLINSYNGLEACRKSNSETYLLENVDNVLYQIGKTFSLPVEVE